MSRKVKIGLYILKNASIDKYYQIFQLYDCLVKDSRFDTLILIDHEKVDKRIFMKYPNENFFNLEDSDEETINNLGLDCLLVTDPYSHPYISYDKVKVPIIYKEYGVAGVETGYGYLNRKPVVKRADMIVTDNDFTLNTLQVTYPSKFIVKGSPAFDYIYNEKYQHKEDEVRDSTIHVLWTPHHSIYEDPIYDVILKDTYSTFLDVSTYLTETFLANHPDVILHLKYHPELPKRFNRLSKKIGSTETFHQYLKSLSKNPQIIIHKGDEDYHDIFDQCDLCINDSLSFIQEWLPTKKPMIILRKSPYSSYGESLVSRCYYEVIPEGHPERVEGVYRLLEKDFKREERAKAASELYIKEGRPNSESLLDIIYKRYSE